MSDTEFYQTRAGRTYYEKTLPELVQQVRRLAEHFGHSAEPEKTKLLADWSGAGHA